jgi:hypothetical protein
VISAALHFAGKYPLGRTALHNWVRYFIAIICSSLRILPDYSLGFRKLMTSGTSAL